MIDEGFIQFRFFVEDLLSEPHHEVLKSSPLVSSTRLASFVQHFYFSCQCPFLFPHFPFATHPHFYLNRGMYPSAAGKIASNGPYQSVKDIYKIPGLTENDKKMFKKYEKDLTANKAQYRTFNERVNSRVST